MKTAPLAQPAGNPDALLDAPALCATLADALAGTEAALASVRPFYLRLKPGVSALLGVELHWRTPGGPVSTLASLYVGEGAEAAFAKAQTLRPVEPEVGPAALLVPALGGLLLAFPNDRALRGLPTALDARRLGNRAATAERPMLSPGWRVKARASRVQVVRWKPGRRAVVRADLALRGAADTRLDETVWVRVHAAGETASRLAAWTAAGAFAPRVRFADPERGLFAVAHVSAPAWSAQPGRSREVLAALAQHLPNVHATRPSGLPVRDDAREAASARATLTMLAKLSPDLAERALRMADRLAEGPGALTTATPGLVHGDLSADQVAFDGERVTLLDWDEAALGDPHADWATLAASGAADGEGCEAAARQALGRSFAVSRWTWHLALAHARQSLGVLQRGGRAWSREAEQRLARCESLLGATRPRAKSVTGFATRVAAQLVPSEARRALPGLAAPGLELTAVWPDPVADAPGAVVARFDDPEGLAPHRWLSLSETATELHVFPADPAFPQLAALMASGEYAAKGHRLGRRVALQHLPSGRFLFLRRPPKVERTLRVVEEAAMRMREVGVPHARVLGAADGLPGWWSEAVEGVPVRAARDPGRTWRRLGVQLARVHGTGGAGALTPEDAFEAEAPFQLAVEVGGAFGDWLRARRDTWARSCAATAGTPAWIHGDLHPLQVVVGVEPVMLDWERARHGEAERDLGNLAAHLAWEHGDLARERWCAFRAGYESQGRTFIGERFRAHACAALLRVLAIHAWRDRGRARATRTATWERWHEEVKSW